LFWHITTVSRRESYLVDIEKIARLNQKLRDQMSQIVVGKENIKESLIIALIAGGHVLIEGMPGTAKTTIAKTFAGVIGGEFKRIQFTPDMMPADVTGFYLYSPDGTSRFVPGPLFANVILADELNRTTPRTQAALLESMQEYQITIDRKTYPLTRPFMVVATQVGYGGEGTYPLTDVQIDRFLLRVVSDYPTKEEEIRMISNLDRIDESGIAAVTNLDEIKEIQDIVKQVVVTPAVIDYITTLVTELRDSSDVQSGPSSRATIALFRCARVLAALEGRNFVIPDDVKHLAFPAIEHRIRIKPEAEMDGLTPHMVLEKLLEQIPVPKPEV